MGLAICHYNTECGMSYGEFGAVREMLFEMDRDTLIRRLGLHGEAPEDQPQKLDDMVGFGGYFEWDTWAEDWEIFGSLTPLLYHSDCDGLLTSQECEVVALAIRRAVNLEDKEDWVAMSIEGLLAVLDDTVAHHPSACQFL